MLRCHGWTVITISLAFLSASVAKDYIEDLYIHPLTRRTVFSHFSFKHEISRPSFHHSGNFPLSILKLINENSVKGLEFSFTRGHWDEFGWGSASNIFRGLESKPPGVQVWATFKPTTQQIDLSWRYLMQGLGGIFCTSMGSLKYSDTAPAPDFNSEEGFSFNFSDQKTQFRQFTFSTKLPETFSRFGFLPRASFCTENLIPWLRLLPCRGISGLSALLKSEKIFSSSYHSMSVSINARDWESEAAAPKSISLVLSFTVVLNPDRAMHQNWTISSLYGISPSHCPLSKQTSVHILLAKEMVHQAGINLPPCSGPLQPLPPNKYFTLLTPPDQQASAACIDSPMKDSNAVSLSFAVDPHNLSLPQILESTGMSLTSKLSWQPPGSQIQVARYLTGWGNERGGLTLEIRWSSNGGGRACKEGYGGSEEVFDLLGFEEQGWWTVEESEAEESGVKFSCDMREDRGRITVLQVVPWFVRLYFHTLAVHVDGVLVPEKDIIKKAVISPARERGSVTAMFLSFDFPEEAETVEISLNFEKEFLRISEHPPDASRGMDIPPALILHSLNSPSADSPGLQREDWERLYAPSLVVSLPLPDFSMPYNVITFTSTIVAMFVGCIMNSLRSKPEEKTKAAPPAGSAKASLIHLLLSMPRLIRVVVVLGISGVFLLIFGQS